MSIGLSHYIDILIKPSAEADSNAIMSRVFKVLHNRLAKDCDNGLQPIGLGWPQYHAKGPGGVLRLFGSKNELENLALPALFEDYLDYCAISHVKGVPTDRITGFASFRRVREKASLKAIQRRAIRRAIDIPALRVTKDTTKKKPLRQPYIEVKSQSNGSRFRLFIERVEKPIALLGEFSSYGLSGESTVPIF